MEMALVARRQGVRETRSLLEALGLDCVVWSVQIGLPTQMKLVPASLGEITVSRLIWQNCRHESVFVHSAGHCCRLSISMERKPEQGEVQVVE